MSDIRIGDRVRVTAGMYAGAVGVVVEVHPAAPNAYAVIDSAGERIAAFTGVLELVTERDIPRTAVADLLRAVDCRVIVLRDPEPRPTLPDELVEPASEELARVATALRKLLGGES
jgi:hypothetical protein